MRADSVDGTARIHTTAGFRRKVIIRFARWCWSSITSPPHFSPHPLHPTTFEKWPFSISDIFFPGGHWIGTPGMIHWKWNCFRFHEAPPFKACFLLDGAARAGFEYQIEILRDKSIFFRTRLTIIDNWGENVIMPYKEDNHQLITQKPSIK